MSQASEKVRGVFFKFFIHEAFYHITHSCTGQSYLPSFAFIRVFVQRLHNVACGGIEWLLKGKIDGWSSGLRYSLQIRNVDFSRGLSYGSGQGVSAVNVP